MRGRRKIGDTRRRKTKKISEGRRMKKIRRGRRTKKIYEKEQEEEDRYEEEEEDRYDEELEERLRGNKDKGGKKEEKL